MKMISGGYYIKAKKIQSSDIAHMPPHVREIWDWLLMRAAYTNGDKIQKGQVLTTYQDIRDALSWKVGYRTERYSKWDCEKAMKMLTKATMVTTTKTTRGLIITICNYNYYQNIKNYESHNESHTKATMKPQPTDTVVKEVKELKEESSIASLPSDNGKPKSKKQRPTREYTISFDKEENKFQGIYFEQVKGWEKLFNLVEVVDELKIHMPAWIIANWTNGKGQKKDWEKFIIGWLSRQQRTAKEKRT